MRQEPFFPLDNRPAHLISRAARLFARIGEEKMRRIGLSVAQLPVLALLKDGTTLSQKELADLIRIEQPTMAQLLARMERDGLILRTPHPDDKRSSLIRLTDTALEKLPAGREIMMWGNQEALRGFSEDETAMLAGLLRRVVTNLEGVADGTITGKEKGTNS